MTRALFVVAAVWASVFALPVTVLASVDHTATLSASKSEQPPALDVLASGGAQNALKATDFFNYSSRVPAKFATTAYFTYDDKNIYVAFSCAQAGIPIVASQNIDHAGVISDDHVIFLLDTSGNGSRIYEFRVSPKGIHDETSTENARYAPEWQSSATIDKAGNYQVTMVIPLTALRSENAPEQHWRMNFGRLIASTSDVYTWAYEPSQNDIHLSQYWPLVNGIKIAASAARPRARADIYALGSGGSDYNQFQNGIGTFSTMKPRHFGVDVAYPLTNTLSLVGTLNPDFSNVEQDQTTIAPQEFQRNYTEYRPFFAEGAQYINAVPSAGLNGIADTLFYTPSIGVFNRGLKMEGTQGNNALGVLNVTGAGFDDSAFGYQHNRSDHTLTLSAEGVLANHTGVRDETFAVALNRNNPRNGEFTIAKLESDTG
ncbi:MAG: DUF5916 domain-containing protein, partial [Candidatus Eremiobacteraeota bacterium]|nr:DUF5916 domain-containing protein [Candidatus Eremiobacteraeota bacterium]